MPNASLAEIYFVTALMLLVVVISVVSIYLFIRTYKKEMREKEEQKRAKELLKESENAEK